MMNSYRAAMIAAISRLVEIPSVFAESPDFPFGPAVDHCLDVTLSMMKDLGFRTFKAPDGMYGYAEIGEGELFGVLCHLGRGAGPPGGRLGPRSLPPHGAGGLALRPRHPG